MENIVKVKAAKKLKQKVKEAEKSKSLSLDASIRLSKKWKLKYG